MTIQGVSAVYLGTGAVSKVYAGSTLAYSAGTAPVNTVLPTISGTATEGETLTGALGTWTGDATITYARQWYRADPITLGSDPVTYNGSPIFVTAELISGATAATYVLTADDVDMIVFERVTGTNGAGSSSADSVATSLVAAADTAVLSLPFSTMSALSDLTAKGMTYTRASSATQFNVSGTIVSVSTDVPRFDFDPVTHEARGLLIESARTNILLNSLLDGTNLSTQTVTVTAQPWALTFYGTGTVTLSGAYSGSLVGSGAFPTRSLLTFTPSAGSLTVTVSGTVKFAQLETDPGGNGGFTSFIPTAGSAVTRAADLSYIGGASFTSFWNPSAGTFVLETFTDRVVDYNSEVLYTTPDFAHSLLQMGVGYGGPAIAAQNVPMGDSDVTGVFVKKAMSYHSGTGTGLCTAARSGIGYGSATGSGTFAGDATQLDFYHPYGRTFNGWIRSVKYYNTEKSEAEMIAATTLIVPATPAGSTLYVAEGDSITAHSVSNGGQDSYARVFAATNTARITFVDQAVSGNVLADLVSRASTTDALIASNPGKKNYNLSVLVGINERLYGTYYPSGAASFLTAYASYVDARRAAGWDVTVFTILPSTDGDDAADAALVTYLATVNAGILAFESVHCDKVIDFASVKAMMVGAGRGPENTYLYNDKLHPSQPGHYYLEAAMAAALSARMYRT